MLEDWQKFLNRKENCQQNVSDHEGYPVASSRPSGHLMRSAADRIDRSQYILQHLQAVI